MIEEARERQRRRRILFATLLGCLAALGIGSYLAFGRVAGTPQGASGPRHALARTTLDLRLAGFGQPLPSAVDRGPCPQGRTVIGIASTSRSRVGTLNLCVLTITKRETPAGRLSQIDQTVSTAYKLPGGTIFTRETQSIRFARDQAHTRAVFSGRVTGGTGRYARARGSVSGGGKGLNGKADWLVSISLR